MITANALICGKKIQLILIKIMSVGYTERRGRPLHYSDIANRLKNDYSQCPDMWQKNIANCYQNNVAWLYMGDG
ncbi:hypothetical protein [Symbiopectobacterium sp. RP]|uniref:hypothetical protein n=1 Tax=Symbiopectobacterium sp. RP TaxID=3248553 RepID=UPI003D2CE1DC